MKTRPKGAPTLAPRKWNGELHGLREFRKRSYDLGVCTRVVRNGDMYTLAFTSTGSMAVVCAGMLDKLIENHGAQSFLRSGGFGDLFKDYMK